VALTHHTVEASGIKQHLVDAGDVPPVLLLRGFPETSYAWRKQIPTLAARPQCGCLPHKERPEAVDASLLDFLGGWSD
jgi:hypothetical protein